jgi:hypothetical protein
MIYADASKISEVIAADPIFLHGVLAELDQIFDADRVHNIIGQLLEALPEEIAAHSPFRDEADIVAAVKLETRRALHRLTLDALPARGLA